MLILVNCSSNEFRKIAVTDKFVKSNYEQKYQDIAIRNISDFFNNFQLGLPLERNTESVDSFEGNGEKIKRIKVCLAKPKYAEDLIMNNVFRNYIQEINELTDIEVYQRNIRFVLLGGFHIEILESICFSVIGKSPLLQKTGN
jgi:hypothetical protein